MDVPLEGTVDGRPFVARSASAKFFRADDEEAFVSIYDEVRGCSDFGPSERHLLASVPWKAGEAYNFNLTKNLTFVTEKDGEIENLVSTLGRIEVIEAPREAGSVGKILVRASARANEVEGAVAVEVCP